MARNNKKVGKSNWEWTNERHVHFLNSMEASFVQSMFQKNNSHVPPLDRYIPDSSESTQDLAKQRRTTSDNVESSERTEKKIRILSCKISSEDQVVPNFENKR
ncbi:hypothetical protein ACS0TY_004468 [Phlomoides rotata]